MAKKKSQLSLPADYRDLLDALKLRIRQSQAKAMRSVNREMIQLYGDIGYQIAERQSLDGWGKGTVERLAKDIQVEFPGIRGFSPTSVWRMRAFFLAYRDMAADLSQPVTELENAVLAQPVTDLPRAFQLKLPEISVQESAHLQFSNRVLTYKAVVE